MRTGGAAGHADFPNQIALLDVLAVFDGDLAHMDIDTVETVTVLKHHGLPGQHHVGLGERHDPVGGGMDRRAGWRGDIEAYVRRARLTVQNALTAVDS